MMERFKRILIAIDVLLILGFIVSCIILTSSSSSSSSYLERLGVKTWMRFTISIAIVRSNSKFRAISRNSLTCSHAHPKHHAHFIIPLESH